MKKQFKLGVIGCGNIAKSILRGVVLSDFIREKKIIVSDIDEEKLDDVHYLGVRTVSDNKFVAENSEFLLIAVKPKNFDEVVKSLDGVRPEKVISVMAGVSKSAIKNALGIGLIKVARCVPDMPCAVGSGAIGIDMLDFNKSNDDTDFISNIFDSLGTVVSLEEANLDAVTAISGNCVYTLMLIDALIDSGVKQGLSRNEAKVLAVQNVLGTAEMVQREEQSIAELMQVTCGIGSSALEAVKTLEDEKFSKTVENAVEASVKKLKEVK